MLTAVVLPPPTRHMKVVIRHKEHEEKKNLSCPGRAVATCVGHATASPPLAARLPLPLVARM